MGYAGWLKSLSSPFSNIGKKLGNIVTTLGTKLPADAFSRGMEKLASLPTPMQVGQYFRNLPRAGGEIISRGGFGYPTTFVKGTQFGKVPRGWSLPTMGSDPTISPLLSIPEAIFSGGAFYG